MCTRCHLDVNFPSSGVDMNNSGHKLDLSSLSLSSPCDLGSWTLDFGTDFGFGVMDLRKNWKSQCTTSPFSSSSWINVQFGDNPHEPPQETVGYYFGYFGIDIFGWVLQSLPEIVVVGHFYFGFGSWLGVCSTAVTGAAWSPAVCNECSEQILPAIGWWSVQVSFEQHIRRVVWEAPS